MVCCRRRGAPFRAFASESLVAFLSSSPCLLAAARGQSLAQLALAWVLRQPAATSALIGASRVEQLEANLATLAHLALADDELQEIEAVLAAPDTAVGDVRDS